MYTNLRVRPVGISCTIVPLNCLLSSFNIPVCACKEVNCINKWHCAFVKTTSWSERGQHRQKHYKNVQLYPVAILQSKYFCQFLIKDVEQLKK